MKKILSLPLLLVKSLKNVFQELKLVDFPSRKDTITMTTTVISVAIVSIIFLISLDTLFVSIRNYLTNI
jgi:preprotein translocase SecE subunit